MGVLSATWEEVDQPDWWACCQPTNQPGIGGVGTVSRHDGSKVGGDGAVEFLSSAR